MRVLRVVGQAATVLVALGAVDQFNLIVSVGLEGYQATAVLLITYGYKHFFSDANF